MTDRNSEPSGSSRPVSANISDQYNDTLCAVERCQALGRAIQHESEDGDEHAALFTLLDRELDAIDKFLESNPPLGRYPTRGTSPNDLLAELRASARVLADLPALLKSFTVHGTRLRLPADIGDKLQEVRQLGRILDEVHYEGVHYDYQEESDADADDVEQGEAAAPVIRRTEPETFEESSRRDFGSIVSACYGIASVAKALEHDDGRIDTVAMLNLIEREADRAASEADELQERISAALRKTKGGAA